MIELYYTPSYVCGLYFSIVSHMLRSIHENSPPRYVPVDDALTPGRSIQGIVCSTNIKLLQSEQPR